MQREEKNECNCDLILVQEIATRARATVQNTKPCFVPVDVLPLSFELVAVPFSCFFLWGDIESFVALRPSVAMMKKRKARTHKLTLFYWSPCSLISSMSDRGRNWVLSICMWISFSSPSARIISTDSNGYLHNTSTKSDIRTNKWINERKYHIKNIRESTTHLSFSSRLQHEWAMSNSKRGHDAGTMVPSFSQSTPKSCSWSSKHACMQSWKINRRENEAHLFMIGLIS